MQKFEPEERNPGAPKFEETTQGETLQQERCARREARDLAKSVCKLTKEDKATFHSPAEAWVILALFEKKPEEREFVIDSGASMHMLSDEGFKLRRTEYTSKVQEHHNGGNGQW